MRSRFRTLLLLSFIAGHAIVLSAGPSLHALLGLEHAVAGSSGSAGDDSSHRHALGSPSHDCSACHLLSLVQHNPDSVASFTFQQTGRVHQPLRVIPPPLEARRDSPSRAPPAVAVVLDAA